MKKLTVTFILFLLVIPNISFAWPVPDTGQTKCYDNEKEIPCPQEGEPFYGQDGNYSINSMSYTKLDANGNDLPDNAAEWVMVRDNVTGLIWEVKTDDGSIHDKDNKYNWQEAQDMFVAQLNIENFGGHSDWRMPSIKELDTLADLGRHMPAIETSYFPNTVSGGYWSSTASGSSGGWHMTFSYGSGIMDSNVLYVRAVRGKKSENNYVDNGDGTVTDINTGLMWQQSTALETMNWKKSPLLL